MAKIILLHGLHMHSWVMRLLAYLLEQEGFDMLRTWRDGSMRTMLMKRCTLSATVWAAWFYAILRLHIRIKSAAVSLPWVRRTKAAGLRNACSIWVCKSRYWAALTKGRWTAVCLSCLSVLSWAVSPVTNHMDWAVF